MRANEFNIGDKVWWAKYERQEVKKICPICFGKLWVTLILGDNSRVQTRCTYCERGYEQYGYVVEYEYVSAVQEVPITHKEVREGSNGRDVEYRYENWVLDEGNAFATKEDAEARLQEMIKVQKQQDLERLEYGKDHNAKKYSWHVGYYQRKKKDAQREIEFYDAKIKHFKAKASEEKRLRQNAAPKS
jgi:hypothetical protein